MSPSTTIWTETGGSLGSAETSSFVDDASDDFSNGPVGRRGTAESSRGSYRDGHVTRMMVMTVEIRRTSGSRESSRLSAMPWTILDEGDDGVAKWKLRRR
jgi:hypothetical protein